MEMVRSGWTILKIKAVGFADNFDGKCEKENGQYDCKVSGLNHRKITLPLTQMLMKGKKAKFWGKNKWPNFKYVTFGKPIRQ